MSTIKKIREAIESKPTRSAWDNGVKVYAAELLDGLQEDIEHGWQDMDVTDSPELLKKPCLTAQRTGANTVMAAARLSMMEI